MAAPEPPKMDGSNFTFPTPYLAQPSAAISPGQPSATISPALPSDASSPAQPSDASSPAQPSAAISPALPSAAISPAQPSAAISPVQASAAISSAQASVAIPSSVPSTSRLPEHLLYKNRLQEYAQKSNIALPMYQTVNEGLTHAPRFRSTVWVDGMSYTSQNTFSHRKAAEQDVAKLALECILKKIRDEGRRFILENATFCKCILYEYAVKLNQEIPPYDTVKREALVPLFISSLVFNGKHYTGHPGRNKKEAEQLAARDAILSILGNPESGTLLPEIIRSKGKLYAAIKNAKGSQDVDTSIVSPIANTGHTSVSAAPVAANNIEMQVGLPERSSGVLPQGQEFQLPKQVIYPDVSKLPNVSLQAGLEQRIDDGSSLKKRKKNKKKANKKSRLDSLSPVAARPLNEVPPCSVSVAQ